VRVRPEAEGAAILAAFLLCLAFLASFVLGLQRGTPAPHDVAGSLAPQRQAPPLRTSGRIQVLNASGRSGVARAATERLRNGGFDVVYFGNAGGTFSGDSTIILDRTGDDAVARAVARHLGLGVVRTQRDTTLFVDATVVIGRDWR
jgi:hypothetical protein